MSEFHCVLHSFRPRFKKSYFLSQIIIFQTFLIRMLVHQPDHHPDYFQSGLIDTTFYYIPRLENYLLNFHQYLILRHQDQQ